MKYIVVPPNPLTSDPYLIDVPSESNFLNVLREHHGGSLTEMVNLRSIVLGIDEEGALKDDREPNAFASILYGLLGAETNIYGTVIITDRYYSPNPIAGVESDWADTFLEKYPDPMGLFTWLAEEFNSRD